MPGMIFFGWDGPGSNQCMFNVKCDFFVFIFYFEENQSQNFTYSNYFGLFDYMGWNEKG